MGSRILYVHVKSPSHIPTNHRVIKTYKMAEQIKPEPEPQLIACTFDPSDVPSKKEEETPKLVKCTFDAPKQNEETEKSSEDEKCQKEDKTPSSDPKEEKAEEKQN